MVLSRILALALCLLAGLGSCQSTNVAQIDATFGYEREVQGRTVRVAVPRAQVESIGAPASSDVVITLPDEAEAEDEVGYHRLILRVRVHNDTDDVWQFGREHLELSFTDASNAECTTCAPTSGAPWKTVTAHSTEEVEIPLVIGLRKSIPMREAEKYWVEFKIRNVPGGEVVMHRRLVLRTYNPGLQILRFAGVLTALLVLGAT